MAQQQVQAHRNGGQHQGSDGCHRGPRHVGHESRGRAVGPPTYDRAHLGPAQTQRGTQQLVYFPPAKYNGGVKP